MSTLTSNRIFDFLTRAFPLPSNSRTSLRQPRMAEHLDIKIKNLEARMMDVNFGPWKKKKLWWSTMSEPRIDVQERSHIFISTRIVYYIAWLEVEVFRKESNVAL